jgi:SAM-dependent methyltransferase
MQRKASILAILLIDQVSSVVLDNPYMFNYIRYLLAGKQKGMKMFINRYLNNYDCKSVYDLCSGTGDFAAVIPTGAKYVGLDRNEDFIEFARKRYKNENNIAYKRLDVLKDQKIINKKYDATMLISAVHHFSDEDLDTLFKLVKKITKKVLIIADIIPDPPHMLQRFFVKIDRGKFVRPAEEKVRLLNKYFKVVHTQEIPTRSAVQYGIVCEI